MLADSHIGLDRIEALERAAARNLNDYADAFRALGASAVDAVPCAGGVAAFAGLDSPLSTVKGAGPEIADRDIERACAFFARHGADRVTFEATPWLTPASLDRLARHGFVPGDTEAVVVADLGERACELAATLFRLVEIDSDCWTSLMLEAWEFSPTPAWSTMARAITMIPKSTALAVVDAAGIELGCAAMVPANEILIFGSDATLPSARGQGVQTASIVDRLRRARASGASLAMAEVAPGSVSERNYLRNGFRLVYTRTHFSRSLE